MRPPTLATSKKEVPGLTAPRPNAYFLLFINDLSNLKQPNPEPHLSEVFLFCCAIPRFLLLRWPIALLS